MAVCGADSPITICGANNPMALRGADHPVTVCDANSITVGGADPIAVRGADPITAYDAANSIAVRFKCVAEAYASLSSSHSTSPARPLSKHGSETCAAE